MREKTISESNTLEWNRFEPLERHESKSDQRITADRRSLAERRQDSRQEPLKLSQRIYIWFLFLIHPRLGVDRRKNNDRRTKGNRHRQRSRPLLSPEEISELLSFGKR
jgi:hypothetical protein